MDLVFIIDSSTSVSDINFSKMLKFVADLVEDADTLSGNVRVGVLTYSTSTHTHITLDNQLSKEELLETIVNIPYVQGSTNTADALLTLRTKMFNAQGDRPNVRNVAVLITDGISNRNSQNTIPEANNARRQGIEIFAVGITLTDTREIEGIAVKFENRFLANTFDELNDVFGELFLSLCIGESMHMKMLHIAIISSI